VQGYVNWQGEFELTGDMDGFHINRTHSEKNLSAFVNSTGKASAYCPPKPQTTRMASY